MYWGLDEQESVAGIKHVDGIPSGYAILLVLSIEILKYIQFTDHGMSFEV